MITGKEYMTDSRLNGPINDRWPWRAPRAERVSGPDDDSIACNTTGSLKSRCFRPGEPVRRAKDDDDVVICSWLVVIPTGASPAEIRHSSKSE
jgi:hypothetical protein